MTKQGSTGKAKLEAAMQSRSPIAQREAIIPVDILEAAVEPLEKSEQRERTDMPSKKSVRSKRTEKPNSATERKNRVILAEPEKPETVRDSYEAYVEQLETIEELHYLYKKKTGRPLTKSRIIREALEYFLPQALDAYKDDEKGMRQSQKHPESTSTSAHIADLENEVQQLQSRHDVDEMYRMDTRSYHSKRWLQTHDHPEGTNFFFKRFLVDGQLPEHASRALYEAKLRAAGYPDEELYLFQDAWKAMLIDNEWKYEPSRDHTPPSR